jgi:hypothetical protein
MNSAIGMDYDFETIQWGMENNVNNMQSGSDRVKLIQQNVLDAYDPNEKFDIICSLNYSHTLLNKRNDLVKYFKNVRNNISKGVYVIDFFGGPHTYSDHRHNNSSDNYVFIGKSMNITTNISLCSLNFKTIDNKYIPLFSYNFRVYSLIELYEALSEAGFNEYKIFIKDVFENEDDQFTDYEERTFEEEFFTDSHRYYGYIFSFVKK